MADLGIKLIYFSRKKHASEDKRWIQGKQDGGHKWVGTVKAFRSAAFVNDLMSHMQNKWQNMLALNLHFIQD